MTLGGEVGECELPHADHGLSAYYVIAPAEASANLARYDGVRYGLRADDADDLIGDVRAHARAGGSATRSSGGSCSAPTRSRPATTTPTTARRSACGPRSPRTSRAAFARFDFLVTPTSPTVAFELGARTENPLAMYLSDYFTVPMSLAGIPAISIPAGLARARRRRARAAGRVPDRRPGVQREPACSTPPMRSSRRVGPLDPVKDGRSAES